MVKSEVAEDTQAAFEAHVRAYPSTRITNMKATLGRSLTAFNVYMQWYPLYDEVKKITGNRLAYLYAHSISQGSNCPLCTTYFRRLIMENGERPDQLVLTGQEQALLDFGGAIATESGEVSEAVFKHIRELYSDEQIVVLTAFAGIMVATNLFNNALQVDIDEYLFPYQSIQP
jgi:alkylhydroperoxidase family enzyme